MENAKLFTHRYLSSICMTIYLFHTFYSSKLFKKWKRATLLFSFIAQFHPRKLWKLDGYDTWDATKRNFFTKQSHLRPLRMTKKMPIFDFWGTFFLPPSFLSDFSIITCPSRPRMSFLGRNKDCCKKRCSPSSTQMIDSKMFCSQRTSLLPPTVSTYRSCDNKLKRYPGKISRVWKWMAYHRLVWTFADCGHNKGKLTKATLMRLLTRQELKKVPSR